MPQSTARRPDETCDGSAGGCLGPPLAGCGARRPKGVARDARRVSRDAAVRGIRRSRSTRAKRAAPLPPRRTPRTIPAPEPRPALAWGS